MTNDQLEGYVQSVGKHLESLNIQCEDVIDVLGVLAAMILVRTVNPCQTLAAWTETIHESMHRARDAMMAMQLESSEETRNSVTGCAEGVGHA